MSDSKSGFVTIVGRPNVGKSTLMNRLIGMKIAITSPKPQTTRGRIKTVYTDERGQIVFLDTPGIHKPKNKLGEYMDAVVKKSLQSVDVILWLVEATDRPRNAELEIAESLKALRTPVLLLVNKIDKADGAIVGECISAFSKLLDFDEIIPVSGKNGAGVKDLLSAIYDRLPEGVAFYDEDTVTEIPMRDIASEIIREKCLLSLNDEIPHGIMVEIDTMRPRDESETLWDIEATIICEKDSHKGIIIGKGGAMLKRIGSSARKELEELCEAKVNLKLFVKVKKDWRESEYLIKSFGYKSEDL